MDAVAVSGVSADINPMQAGSARTGRSHHYTPSMPESICERSGVPWRMVRIFIVDLILSLTACTLHTENTRSQEFVGHAVSEAVLKLGPPTTKMDLGNGRMAFDWLHYGPCSYSAIATSRKPSPSLADWTIESWQETADCSAAR
jgi:hypothetical protein